MIRARLAALLLCGCARATASPPPPPVTPLFLEHPCDLAPAAHVSWVLEASPRAFAETAALIPAIGLVVPEARFRAFAVAHGVDLRQMRTSCIAHYPSGDLAIVKTPFDPAVVERAWQSHTTRTTRRTIVAANPPVARLDGDSEELLVFDRDTVVLARGTKELARAALAFAEGRLKRASPALRGPTLARLSDVMGPAPMRFFVPGPFGDEDGRGLGGLLAATTAVGVAARPEGPSIAVRVALAGAWGDDAGAASERLLSALHVASEKPLPKLLGLDRPATPPDATGTADALVVDFRIDGNLLARGLHAALDAEVTDMMTR